MSTCVSLRERTARFMIDGKRPETAFSVGNAKNYSQFLLRAPVLRTGTNICNLSRACVLLELKRD